MKERFVYTLLLCVCSVYTLAGEKYCYEPYGAPVGEEFVAGRVLVQVVWVEGERGSEVHSSWSYDEETDTTICKVWIRRPEQVEGDPDMTGVGHEFLHCAIGDFHE